ncbi:MAG: hypothetical protein L0I24_00225 [Pseudonocardia sp.]|nr:hypothetical protein [Pseudonocardia sp.]
MAGEITSRVIRILFEGDASGVQGAAGQAESSFSKFNRAAVGASLGIVGGAVAIGTELVQMAAQAEQSIGSVDTVFKENSAQVKQWATDAATNLGLSSHAYREAATLIGSQLKNMGVPMDQVAGQTDGLITKGADLASMFGGTTQEAVDALSSALKGEADPIERYGISLNAAAIEGKKAELGLAGLTGAADRNAQAMAVMALIEEQSADATGNFAREQGTAAGQAERAKAQWENLQTTIGEQLLPIMTGLGTFLSGTLLPILQEHSGVIFTVAGVIVGLAAAVLAVNGAVAIWRAGVVAYTAVQWALNSAMLANPIGLVVLAIVALVAAFVIAYQNSETFRNIVNGVFAAVQSFIAGAVEKIKGIIGWFAELPGRVGAWFSGMRDSAIRQAAALVGWLTGLPGRVLGAIGNLGSMLVNAGRDLLGGLWRGIQNGAGWLRDRIFSFFGSIIPGWVKNILGIRSPSKVFADQVGRHIPAGVGLGIEKGTPGLLASAREMGDAARRAASDGLGDMVQLGDVDAATFDRLKTQGWMGRAGDGMEALHRPQGAGATPTYVTVMIDGQEFRGMVKTEIGESNRQTRRGVGSGAYRGV